MPIPSAESTGVFSVSGRADGIFVPGGRVPQAASMRNSAACSAAPNLRSSIGPRLHYSARCAELPHSDRRTRGGGSIQRGLLGGDVAAQLAEGLIGTLVLWRLSGMTLGSLRLWN